MSAATAAFLGSGRRMRATVAPADHCQPGLRLAAELDPIADAGAGDPGFCNGPRPDSCTAAKLGACRAGRLRNRDRILKKSAPRSTT